jgi:hypothetical protein
LVCFAIFHEEARVSCSTYSTERRGSRYRVGSQNCAFFLFFSSDSRCYSGYHKPFLSLTKCWESNSRQWQSILSIPAKMKKKCSYKGYSENVFGDCKNKNHNAHMSNLDAGCRLSCSRPYCKRRGWRIKCYAPKCNLSCWSRCPWNHYIAWWSPWKCVERCPSTRQAVLGKCYDKSCNSGYSRTWDYLTCMGSKRNQKSHGALCNYSVKSGTKARRDWLTGMCWQTCTSGETEILGQCFPKAELRISIQDIFDALEDIMGFIEGLPLGEYSDMLSILLRFCCNQKLTCLSSAMRSGGNFGCYRYHC